MKIIAVGDNCIDFYIHQNKKYIGGCSVNFAVYVKQLGIESAYLGSVGTDENGNIMIEGIKEFDIDTSHIHMMSGNTAITKVELIDNDRHFVGYDEGVLKELQLDEEDFQYIAEYDYVHTSVYGNIDRYLPKIKKLSKICYDFADKFDYQDMDLILEQIEFAFFSYKQDDSFIREFLKKTYDHGLTCAIATLGENGSIAYDGINYYLQEIHKVEVVDTIGAGDSFIAGFMCAVAMGEKIENCLKSGASKAEKTITHFGAF